MALMEEPQKTSAIETEGVAPVLGFNIFYRSYGKPRPEKGTILCLHGGPGATHDFMAPLADLTEYGYRVIMYDQLGCGKSDHPKNRALFVIERYVEEVEAVRKKLGLGRVHIYGSSWGGALALAYLLKYQRNAKTLIMKGGLASFPEQLREIKKIRESLPVSAQRTMEKYEAMGDYDNPAYLKAYSTFQNRHICRLPEWPPELAYTMNHVNKMVYETMNGPNEFLIIGNLRYWDITNQLHKIKVPTLITVGKYDEVPYKVAESMQKRIKSSRIVMFRKSSHTALWEERRKYIQTLRKFLDTYSS